MKKLLRDKNNQLVAACFIWWLLEIALWRLTLPDIWNRIGIPILFTFIPAVWLLFVLSIRDEMGVSESRTRVFIVGVVCGRTGGVAGNMFSFARDGYAPALTWTIAYLAVLLFADIYLSYIVGEAWPRKPRS